MGTGACSGTACMPCLPPARSRLTTALLDPALALRPTQSSGAAPVWHPSIRLCIDLCKATSAGADQTLSDTSQVLQTQGAQTTCKTRVYTAPLLVQLLSAQWEILLSYMDRERMSDTASVKRGGFTALCAVVQRQRGVAGRGWSGSRGAVGPVPACFLGREVSPMCP